MSKSVEEPGLPREIVVTGEPEMLEQVSSVVGAAASMGLFIVALIALIFARGTWKTAQEANRQAKADSIARTRPYVFVEIVPSIGNLHGNDVKITNTGQSSATDLHLTYYSWPDELDDIGEATRELFDTKRTLPPGCSIRAYWKVRAAGKFEDGSNEAGLPLAGIIVVHYGSNDPSHPEYSEEFPILSAGLTPVGSMGPTPAGDPSIKQFFQLGQRVLARLTEISRA